MTRWYQGFRCKGDPEIIKKLVIQKVHQDNLACFVPAIKPEKKRSPSRRKTSSRAKTRTLNVEFYLFIAIESQEIGQLPPAVKSNLVSFLQQLEISYKGKPYKTVQWVIPEGFLYEEIKTMAESDFDVYNFTQSIPYKPQQREVFNDSPFELLELEPAQHNGGQARSQNYDKLLYFLSTSGQGTWEFFKKACQALDFQEPKSVRKQLKLLGHLEVSPNGKYWSVTPTSLVEIDSISGYKEFILCGQQNKRLLNILGQYGDIQKSTTQSASCVKFAVSEPINITDIIEKINNNNNFVIAHAGNAAIKLAEILPDLEGWKLSLQCLPGIQPSSYRFKVFENNEFVDCMFSNQVGMYELWELQDTEVAKSSQNQYPILTLFYDAKTDTWRQGDWYGLRFLALSHSEQRCRAFYNPATSCLAIPHSQRWPELYERALVLSSGQLPTYQQIQQNLWLIYEKISIELAEQLTIKLDVILEEGSNRCTI